MAVNLRGQRVIVKSLNGCSQNEDPLGTKTKDLEPENKHPSIFYIYYDLVKISMTDEFDHILYHYQ